MIWIIVTICHFNYYNITVGIVLLFKWKFNFHLAPLQVELFIWCQNMWNFLPLLLNAPLKNVFLNIWFVGEVNPAKWCTPHLNATTSPSWYIYICKLRVKIDHNDGSFLPSAPNQEKKNSWSKRSFLYKISSLISTNK